MAAVVRQFYRFLQKDGLHRQRLRAIANAVGVQPRLKKAKHHLDVSSRPRAKRIVLCLTQRGSDLETTDRSRLPASQVKFSVVAKIRQKTRTWSS
jgi:hypothetical protein